MTTKTEEDVIVTELSKITAVMAITNVLLQQPQGVTEATLWQQTCDDHGTLTEPEFKHLLAAGIEQGALVQTGDRYMVTPEYRQAQAEASDYE